MTSTATTTQTQVNSIKRTQEAAGLDGGPDAQKRHKPGDSADMGAPVPSVASGDAAGMDASMGPTDPPSVPVQETAPVASGDVAGMDASMGPPDLPSVAVQETGPVAPVKMRDLEELTGKNKIGSDVPLLVKICGQIESRIESPPAMTEEQKMNVFGLFSESFVALFNGKVGQEAASLEILDKLRDILFSAMWISAKALSAKGSENEALRQLAIATIEALHVSIPVNAGKPTMARKTLLDCLCEVLYLQDTKRKILQKIRIRLDVIDRNFTKVAALECKAKDKSDKTARLFVPKLMSYEARVATWRNAISKDLDVLDSLDSNEACAETTARLLSPVLLGILICLDKKCPEFAIVSIADKTKAKAPATAKPSSKAKPPVKAKETTAAKSTPTPPVVQKAAEIPAKALFATPTGFTEDTKFLAVNSSLDANIALAEFLTASSSSSTSSASTSVISSITTSKAVAAVITPETAKIAAIFKRTLAEIKQVDPNVDKKYLASMFGFFADLQLALGTAEAKHRAKKAEFEALQKKLAEAQAAFMDS